MRIWLPVLFGAAVLAGGCVSVPTPNYLRVDRDAPEFHAAVAQEAGKLRVSGQSPKRAETLATEKVIDQRVAAAKTERAREVAPLQVALAPPSPPPAPPAPPAAPAPGAHPKPVPDAWAYTLSSTIRTKDEKGVRTMTEVERFDPSQPEERLWTALSIRGRAPSAEDQAKYRLDRLKRWRKMRTRQAGDEGAPPDLGWLGRQSDLTISPPDPAGWVSYAFTTAPMRVAGMRLPASRRTYTIDSATKNLMARSQAFLGMWSLFFGAVKFEAFDLATDYRIERADLPPVPSRAHSHMAIKGFGHEMDMATDQTYSDYKRVVSYDKRFVVWIETPTMVDLTAAPGLLRGGN